MIHGLRSSYVNHLCRCSACTEAQRLWQQQYRVSARAIRQDDPALITHGTNGSYVNYACRCADCTRAHREARR